MGNATQTKLAWQVHLLCLLLCLGSVSSSRRLMQNSVLETCSQLSLSIDDSATVAHYCNAKGQPLCCDKLNLLVKRSLTSVVESTGSFIEEKDDTQTYCYQRLFDQLVNSKLLATTGVLALCGVSNRNFSSAAIAQCGILIGTWTSIRELAALPVPDAKGFAAVADLCATQLGIPDVGEQNPASCAGEECELAVKELGSLLANRGGPLTSPAVCSDLVRIVLPAVTKQVGSSRSPAGAALTRCLWDPSLTAKCTYYSFSSVDFSSVYAACMGAVPTDPLAQSQAVSRCWAAVVSVALVAVVQRAFLDASFAPPPMQRDACVLLFWDALAYHGVSNASSPILRATLSAPPRESTFLQDLTPMSCGPFNATIEMRSLPVVESVRQKCALKITGESFTCPNVADCQAVLSPTANPAWGLLEDPSDRFSQAGQGCSKMGLVTWLVFDYGSNVTALMKAISCTLDLSGAYELKPNLTYLATGVDPDYEAGKGVLPVMQQGTSGNSSSREKALVGALACVGAVAVGFALLACGLLWRSQSRLKGMPVVQKGSGEGLQSSGMESSAASDPDCTTAIYPDSSSTGLSFSSALQRFSLAGLYAATQNFSSEKVLGEGGFGRVYSGSLQGGIIVAVKRWLPGFQGEKEFLNELRTLSRLRHENIIVLLGYCSEGDERLLVYQHMAQGSLKEVLHGVAVHLPWLQRLTIAFEVARGLDYLHNSATPRVLHRDVKASNILLDERFTAKIADFGLSKCLPDEDDTHFSTEIRGTAAYLDPQYLSTKQLTEKSDVYSLGILLLELLTGRRPVDHSRSVHTKNMLNWAKPLHVRGELRQLVDSRLDMFEVSDDLLSGYCKLAFACVQSSGSLRPTIRAVKTGLGELVQSKLESSSSEIEEA